MAYRSGTYMAFDGPGQTEPMLHFLALRIFLQMNGQKS